MTILGFETTDVIASVALFYQGELYCSMLDETKRHAESVLPAADALLRAHNLTTADVDLFAVDVGPGSFTGVRIGVCLANALAYAHHKPVVAVNSLEVLAEPFAQSEKPICALIDARNDNGYGALYQKGSCLILPCACVQADFLANVPSDAVFTGSACPDHALPKADSVVRIAMHQSGSVQVSPMYLRPSQAERLHNA